VSPVAALVLAVTAAVDGGPRAALPTAPEGEIARVLAVRVTPVGSRQALHVLCTRPVAEAKVERQGNEVVVSLEAEAPDSLSDPPATPPLEAIRIVRRPGGVSLWVRVAPEVPFEVKRQETLVTVLFGGEGAGQPLAPPTAPVDELYPRLFPGSTGEAAERTEERSAGAGSETPGAWSLGPLTLRPSLILSYVDADVAGLAGPTPVRDRYLQIQPGLAGEMPVLDGKLQASYEPRLRSFSSYPEVGTTTHLANATLDLPVGTSLTLRAGEHFAHGILETTEVDPGREYFFALGTFTRWRTDLGARWELGGRLGLDLGAAWNQVAFDTASSFFPYRNYSLSAGLGYEMTPSLRAVLGYTYESVPRPDQRPLAESTAHSVGLSLKGDITPLITGQIEVAYRDQTSPLAAAGGQSFRGLTSAVSLKKEFRPDSWLDLFVNRATELSAFEQNGFYVTTAVQAGVTLPVPFSCSFRGGVGYQWNTYRTAASAIGVPREDTILAWSVGLGRPLGNRAFLRGDYRRERRDSNLQEFNITTHSLIVQLGIGLFGAPVRR
jgi:hypothetical protein